MHPKEQNKTEQETDDFTVGYILCGMEFGSEEASDEHDCPAYKKTMKVAVKKEPKVEMEDGNILNGNKRSTHSSKVKK